MSDVTLLLQSMERGEKDAPEELFTLVYDELRKLATLRMAREAAGNTLQATALVHEVWLRLFGSGQPPWRSRAHFFGAAAEAMRRILIERARAKRRLRRGGARERVPLENVTLATDDDSETVLAVHEALDRLAAQDELKSQIVKLRYFVGMTHDEIATTLGIAEPTVRRHWAFARSWLYAELKRELNR